MILPDFEIVSTLQESKMQNSVSVKCLHYKNDLPYGTRVNSSGSWTFGHSCSNRRTSFWIVWSLLSSGGWFSWRILSWKSCSAPSAEICCTELCKSLSFPLRWSSTNNFSFRLLGRLSNVLLEGQQKRRYITKMSQKEVYTRKLLLAQAENQYT